MGNLEETMGGSTLGMDNSLGNSLPVEVSQLVNEMEVRDDHWAVFSSGH